MARRKHYNLITPASWRHSLRPVTYAVAKHLPVLIPVSLAKLLPAPLDQLETSSCSGHALIENFYARQVALGQITQTARPYTNDPTILGSPLFNYYCARVIEKDPGEDAGANIDDNVTAAASYGICQYGLWPTENATVTQNPPPAAYANALRERLQHSTRVANDRYTITSLLANQKLVTLGIPLFEEAESDTVAASGIIPLPKHRSSLLGYHAVTIHDSDPVKMKFKATFHWFNEDDVPWGDDGSAILDYTYIERMGSSAVVLDAITETTPVLSSTGCVC